MKPATNLKVDIAHSGFVSPVEAVQGDGGLRSISVELTDRGRPWYPPAGTEVAVAYTHSNGTKGLYNKLPDGKKAVTVRNNIVTAVLAQQMLAAAGEVKAAIVFTNEKLDQLTTFPITITVKKNLFADAQETVDYIRLQWLEDKLDEYLKKAKDSGVFDGPKGDAFTYEDFTPEQLAALTGPQGPIGETGATGPQGPQGVPGHDGLTPVKGVDYGTPTEIAAISAQATSQVQTQIDSLRTDLTANSNADTEIHRKLNFLWRMNQGFCFHQETDEAESYAKAVPDSASAATVCSFAGNTVAWNQIIPSKAAETKNGIAITPNGDGSYHIVGTASANVYFPFTTSSKTVSGHKYLFCGSPDGCGALTYIMQMYANALYLADHVGKIVTVNEGSDATVFQLFVGKSQTVDFVIRPFCVDLTQAFGMEKAENLTMDSPEIAWIRQYAETHPGYNSGELVSAVVESIKYNGSVMADIPAVIRNLPGYGWSADDVYNSIERTEDGIWQYVQRVGSRVYQDGDTITDGVTTYYVLDTPVISDITDLMAGASCFFEVMAGGTITFENAAKLSVPSRVKYTIPIGVNG